MDINKNRSNTGYTIFEATGVSHEFPHIDLVKRQVIGTVVYKGKTYMTVAIDLNTDTVQVEGNVDELGDLSMDKESYIEMFKHLAQFFIENNISNVDEYLN